MQLQRGGILLGTLLILLVPGHDLREQRHGVDVTLAVRHGRVSGTRAGRRRGDGLRRVW